MVEKEDPAQVRRLQGITQPMNDTWITTYTGKKFYPLAPIPGNIDILDIAHALSMICRFNGCCKEFYSVAEHCVRASYLVPRDQKLAALLHDSTEAYMADLGRPIKAAIPLYKELETELLICILLKFGVINYDEHSIKRTDNILLATEGRDLMNNTDDWNLSETPLTEKIEPLTQSSAKELFLHEFKRLYNT